MLGSYNLGSELTRIQGVEEIIPTPNPLSPHPVVNAESH